MRSKDHHWSLFHFNERNQLDGLKTDQVEAIFAAIPEKDRAQWMIWREGFLNWKRFADFPTLLQGLRGDERPATEPKAPSPPSLPGDELERERDRSLIDELEQNFELEEGSTNKDTGPGRRDGARRYKGHFEVAALGPKGRFRTRTVNASLNGVQLADPLPDWIPRYFTLEMRGPDGEVIAMLCMAIRDAAGQPSTRVRIESNDHVNVLRSWLLKL